MSGELDKLNLRLLIILGLSPESAATVMERIGDLERERDELARWKKEALLVESRWDCQKVGKLLGLRLGEDIRPNIELKIRELLDARHQVETRLNDALAELHRFQCIERGETPPP